MDTLKLIITILQLLCGLAIIVVFCASLARVQACPAVLAVWQTPSWPETRLRQWMQSLPGLPNGWAQCS